GGRGRGGQRGGGLGGAAGGAPGAPGQAGAIAGVTLPGGAANAPGPAGFGGGPLPVFRQEVRIVADEVTNSLVILATKRDYQLVLDVVRKIDVLPPQVGLQGMIAEGTLHKALQFGIAYACSEGALNAAIPTGSTTTPIFVNRGGQGSGQPPPPGSPFLGGLLGTATRTPASGAFAVITDQQNFNIFINALNNVTRVKMLSA